MHDQIAGISVAAILHLLIAIPVCAHILLHKEQESAAIAWIGVVLLSPFVGSLLYWLFGINRIQRRARRLHRRKIKRRNYPPGVKAHVRAAEAEGQRFHLGEAVHAAPFIPGNVVLPLVNGDAAYPVMLAAIAAAKTSVALSSYIFDYDPAGVQFMAALIDAHRRGVAVRVLLDNFGTLYSPRSVERALRKAGVAVAPFMSSRLSNIAFINLRNHRKLLIVDGEVGFIGGMNIRYGNLLAAHPPSPVQDIHFSVTGPAIDQMNLVFENDWSFAVSEEARLPAWRVREDENNDPSAPLARIVTSGPDEAPDKLPLLLMGALATCRQRVAIMTPYFLPSETITSALVVAALRGIDVELLVPARSNILPMDWAMQPLWKPLVDHGVRVTLTRPPFDHSKVMVVDKTWVLVGSTNWDARSLRLNFEANLECHDPQLAARLEAYIEAKRAEGRRLTRDDVHATPLALQMRNRLVHLFASYL